MIETWLANLGDLLGASKYAAHSICLTSDRLIVNLFVLADGSIGLAYYVLALVLYIAYRARTRVIRVALALLGDPVFLKLFAAFILACGITHHTMVLTLFYGVYYLDVFARCVTAGVSIAAAWRVLVVSFTSKASPYEFLMTEPIPPYESKPLNLPPPGDSPSLKR